MPCVVGNLGFTGPCRGSPAPFCKSSLTPIFVLFYFFCQDVCLLLLMLLYLTGTLFSPKKLIWLIQHKHWWGTKVWSNALWRLWGGHERSVLGSLWSPSPLYPVMKSNQPPWITQSLMKKEKIITNKLPFPHDIKGISFHWWHNLSCVKFQQGTGHLFF